ncbi:MAG: OsmC family protein [Bryobacteraceae bacterium]
MSDANLANIQAAGDGRFIAIVPSGHAQVVTSNGREQGAASPMELLLIALGTCTAIDVESILKKKRERVTSYRVEVHGDRREEYPKSFTKMYVRHIFRGHALKEEAVQRAIELSETKYCSVAATLRPTVEIVSSYTIEEEPAA